MKQHKERQEEARSTLFSALLHYLEKNTSSWENCVTLIASSSFTEENGTMQQLYKLVAVRPPISKAKGGCRDWNVRAYLLNSAQHREALVAESTSSLSPAENESAAILGLTKIAETCSIHVPLGPVSSLEVAFARINDIQVKKLTNTYINFAKVYSGNYRFYQSIQLCS